MDLNLVGFFTANDGLHGDELWNTDGTETGTVIVKDIIPVHTEGNLIVAVASAVLR